MAYPVINSTADTSIASLLVYTGEVFPAFWPLALTGLWLIIALGSYFSQQRIRGSADFIGSAAVASVVTLTSTFVLSLIPGLISIYMLGIALVVTLITVWMHLASEDKL